MRVRTPVVAACLLVAGCAEGAAAPGATPASPAAVAADTFPTTTIATTTTTAPTTTTTVVLGTPAPPAPDVVAPLVDVGGDWCFAAANLDTGQLVVGGTRDGLTPASSLKLFTAAAALLALGPDHRFTTSAIASGRSGDEIETLYLVGGGDPVLGGAAGEPATSLDDLATAVARAGVTTIGTLVPDEARFDEERLPATWSDGFRAAQEPMYLSALSFGRDGGPRDAAQAFAAALAAEDVVVGSRDEPGTAPPGDPLATVESPRLSELLPALLVASDNYLAEMLLKALGAEVGGEGSRVAGVAAVRDLLAPLEPGPYTMVDGSGGSRDNAVPCLAFVRVMFGLDGTTAGDLVVGHLPAAGESGRLEDRFVGTPLAGRLFAKTGALADAVSLTGLLLDADDSRWAFSLITNGPGGAPVLAAHEAAVLAFSAG